MPTRYCTVCTFWCKSFRFLQILSAANKQYAGARIPDRQHAAACLLWMSVYWYRSSLLRFSYCLLAGRDSSLYYLRQISAGTPEAQLEQASAPGTARKALRGSGTPEGLFCIVCWQEILSPSYFLWNVLRPLGPPAGLSAATRVPHVQVCAMVTRWECDERAMRLSWGPRKSRIFGESRGLGRPPI